MDKRDVEPPKIFDGEKFSVWRFHMEICFGDTGTMPIVNGTLPKPPETATEEEKLAWEKADS